MAVDTTAPTLLAAAKCFECYGGNEYSLLLMKLSLLRQLVLAINPMADTTPQTLLAQAKCFQCYATSPYMLLLMELALMQSLVTGGGVGGGGGLDLEDGPVDRANFPDNEPAPTTTTIFWLRGYRDGTPGIWWDKDATPPRWRL